MGRKSILTNELKQEILEAFKDLFFNVSVAGRVGVLEDTLASWISRSKEFASSVTHAKAQWIEQQQKDLQDWAQDKKTKDWRAKQYLLSIAKKEFSEKKYLAKAIADRESPRITMIFNAKDTTQAKKQAEKIIGSKDLTTDDISILPKDNKLDKQTLKNITRKG